MLSQISLFLDRIYIKLSAFDLRMTGHWIATISLRSFKCLHSDVSLKLKNRKQTTRSRLFCMYYLHFPTVSIYAMSHESHELLLTCINVHFKSKKNGKKKPHLIVKVVFSVLCTAQTVVEVFIQPDLSSSLMNSFIMSFCYVFTVKCPCRVTAQVFNTVSLVIWWLLIFWLNNNWMNG